MKKIAIGFSCLLITICGIAQTVSAIVKDSITNAPVKFATVRVRNFNTDSILNETITDEKGRFTFTRLPKGNFKITLSAVGYNSKTFTVAIMDDNTPANDGIIFLTPVAETLKEVVVKSRRYLVEEKIDRTVYNVEKDSTLISGNAIDAFRRVPLLSVDIDGNVSLRGSSDFKVLINNKPSTISANNLADALKQIPADQIKSIEVITSPSAKYDADGAAGIINIILKKNELLGAILFSDMAIGTRAAFLGLDGAYNTKKMAFSIGGFGRTSYNVTGQYNNVQSAGVATTYQDAAIRKNDIAANYTLGWDYEPDKNDFVNASLRYSDVSGHNFQDNLFTNIYQGGSLDSTALNQVQVNNRSGTVDISTGYTHTFAKPQQEFSFLTLFSRTDRANGFTNVQQKPANDTLIGRLTNNDRSSNQEITLQADYQAPLGSSQLLDFGAKYIIRDVVSNYQYLNAVGGEGDKLNMSPALTNIFNYHQNVTAGYFDYTYSAKSAFSFRVGARYEFTAINAQLQSPSTPLPNIPSYGVLVPNINLAWRLGNGKMIKLAYTRRIQRPSFQYLNPNIIASNPVSVTTGNPALGPEYTNNIEVGYNTAIKQTTIDFSAFYRSTTNAIESITAAGTGDTINTTYANIGKATTCGINIFSNLAIGQKVSLSVGVDLYYTTLQNGINSPDTGNTQAVAHNQGFTFSARLSGGYTFKKGWTLYLFSRYQGRQILLQGYQTGFPYYSLTLKKDFMKKKGTIGFGAENFLSRGITVKNYIQSEAFYQSASSLTRTLSLRIYISYSLGKLSIEKPERKKKSITNDDLKPG